MNNPIERAFAEWLRVLDEAATPGQWMIQDGCSWRRLGTHMHDGDVLCPMNARDGHPDLTARDGKLYANLNLITYLRNAVPAILAMADENARLIAIEAAAQKVIASASTLDPDLPEDANVYAPYLADLRRALGKDHANAQG